LTRIARPHCILDASDKRELDESAVKNLVMFDEMVADEGLPTNIRAIPNTEYCLELGSWNKV
jgi:hypothetical protein